LHREAQKYLASQLSIIRLRKSAADDVGWSDDPIQAYRAVIHVLNGIGEISDAECTDWLSRVLFASGLRTADSLAEILNTWSGELSDVADESEPRLLNSFRPAEPDRYFGHGGKASIDNVELRESRVVIYWRVLLDSKVMYAEQFSALTLDSEGLSEKDIADLEEHLTELIFLHWSGSTMTLTDNCGTKYRFDSGKIVRLDGGSEGSSDFVPEIPTSATRLEILWHDLEFDVPLHVPSI
jgi:hypothetical protein